jgi:hypothetical protein
LPIAGSTDVVVCGGGPAGVCAALAAAHAGATVSLIESRGALGGMMTTGSLPWILDSDDKPGIVGELVDQFNLRAYAPSADGPSAFDVESVKLILEQRCLDAGIRIRYHTTVAASVVKERCISAAITESKTGREAWLARTFVDATGDGDLAFFSGCRWEQGEEETGAVQPMSLIARVTGIKLSEVRRFVNHIGKDAKAALLEELERAGIKPSYVRPALFRINDTEFCLMSNHVYRVDGTSADDITGATIQARAELHRQVDALRRLGGMWKNLRISHTAEHVGVRETRRIRGLYTVTFDDMLEGRRHRDAVCTVRSGVDIHALDPDVSAGDELNKTEIREYDIPLRALVAADIDNLVLSGRCISGDFPAHSSYRVMGDAMATGAAAGACAATAALTKASTHQVRIDAVRPIIGLNDSLSIINRKS